MARSNVAGGRLRVVRPERPAPYVEILTRDEFGGVIRLHVGGVVEVSPGRGAIPPAVTVGDLREALGMLEALSLDES